jgi:hypothetical protein
MVRIRKYSEYVEYFRALCEGHKLLNPTNTVGASHFYEFEENFLGTKLKPLSFVLLPPLCGLKDQLSDNVIKEFRCEFWILKSVARENTAARLAALDVCETVGFDILKRIKKHHAEFSLLLTRPVIEFDLNTVQWEQVAPKHSDNFHGYSFEFPFGNNVDIAETAANWW